MVKILSVDGLRIVDARLLSRNRTLEAEWLRELSAASFGKVLLRSMLCALLWAGARAAQANEIIDTVGSRFDRTKEMSNQVVLALSKDNPDEFRILQRSGTLGPEGVVPTHYWPVGKELHIKFLSGTAEQREFVKQVAAEWFAHANLVPIYVDDAAPAEVRIRVLSEDEYSFSYLGTSSIPTQQSELTMQLSLPDDASEDWKRNVVLHEFGHMLGLPPEEANPNVDAVMDWERVYAHFEGWDKDRVNVFYRPERESSALYTGKPFDPQSVMMHLPVEVISGVLGLPIQQKTTLSQGDKEFIAKVYPRTSSALVSLRDAARELGAESASVLDVPLATAQLADSASQRTSLEDTLTPLTQVAPSATLTELNKREAEALRVENDIVAAFARQSADEQARTVRAMGKAYVESLNEAKRSSRDKAVYGFDDQYAPETYRTIYERAQSVCFVSTNSKRLGTCFMIGKDLVLTCGHTLRESRYSDDFHDTAILRVGFGAMGVAAEGTFQVNQLVFRGTASSVDGIKTEALDFALLELGHDSSQQLPSDKGILPLPVDANRGYPKDTAVYVIGYPGATGVKTVADNSRIFLGFDSSHLERTEYILRAHGEAELLAGAANKKQYANPNQQLAAVTQAKVQGDQLVTSIESSLRRGGNQDRPRWYLISDLMAVPAHPAFALDSDTYHGNSGSPVLARGSSEVTGVLFRGADDRLVDLQVGYLKHEEAMPIHVLLENWRDQQPDKPALYGVSF